MTSVSSIYDLLSETVDSVVVEKYFTGDQLHLLTVTGAYVIASLLGPTIA